LNKGEGRMDEETKQECLKAYKFVPKFKSGKEKEKIQFSLFEENYALVTIRDDKRNYYRNYFSIKKRGNIWEHLPLREHDNYDNKLSLYCINEDFIIFTLEYSIGSFEYAEPNIDVGVYSFQLETFKIFNNKEYDFDERDSNRGEIKIIDDSNIVIPNNSIFLFYPNFDNKTCGEVDCSHMIPAQYCLVQFNVVDTHGNEDDFDEEINEDRDDEGIDNGQEIVHNYQIRCKKIFTQEGQLIENYYNCEENGYPDGARYKSYVFVDYGGNDDVITGFNFHEKEGKKFVAQNSYLVIDQTEEKAEFMFTRDYLQNPCYRTYFFNEKKYIDDKGVEKEITEEQKTVLSYIKIDNIVIRENKIGFIVNGEVRYFEDVIFEFEL